MSLKPVLGLAQLLFYSVGVIVGAGVYSVIGAAAGLAGEAMWWGFVISAAVALLTAFSYAEMTTLMPAAGAEYAYLRRALPRADFIAFVVGAAMLMGAAATAATVAVAFGGYMREFIDAPVWLSAIVLIAACTALNLWGLRESSWANAAFTTIEVGGLILVIAAGVARGGVGGMAQPLATAPGEGVLAASALLFFVYLGFEEVANVAEEARNPGRDMPRAIFWSLGITTVLYVLVALAAVVLASPAELAGSAAPLTIAVQRIWPGLGGVISGIALFSTANTVLITLIAASRLVFSMGRDGEIPHVFAAVTAGRATPWAGAILLFVGAAAFTAVGNVGFLAELSSFTALIAFAAVNAALIVLRFREPSVRRKFRSPLAVGRLPVLPVLAIASILGLGVYFDRAILITGVAALAIAAALFALRHRLRK